MVRTRTPSKRYPGVYSMETARGERRWGAVVDLGRDWETGKRQQERREGMATQAEAAAWATERRNARRRGVATVSSDQPVGAYLAEWLDRRTPELRPSTVRAYRGIIRNLAPLHGVKLEELRPIQVETVERRLVERGYRPATVRLAHGVLSAALRDAVRLELLPRNPCDAVRPPAGASPPRRWIDADQIRRLLAATGDDITWGSLWALLAECWLRVGEAAALRWHDVDLGAGVVTVTRTRTIDRGGKAIDGPVKTAAGRRALPISPRLVGMLRQHRVRHRSKALAAGLVWDDALPVWPREDGREPRNANTINDELAGACRRAGLPVVSVHELRHSGGSAAHTAGLDLKTISERLGHANVAVTMGIYVHKGEADHRRLSDAIGAIFDPGEPAGGVSA